MQVSKSAELAEASEASPQVAGQSATITQTYSGWGDTNADYVVKTYAESRQVRIIKEATNEVLASFTLPDESEAGVEEDQYPLHEALRKIGLPVQVQEADN